jgi:hypothetical protein
VDGVSPAALFFVTLFAALKTCLDIFSSPNTALTFSTLDLDISEGLK